MAQKTDFSEILKKLRLKRGISQKNAAANLGVSQALLSHYEKGIRECGLNFLIKCAKFYKVSTDCLLGLCEDTDIEFEKKDADVENINENGTGETDETHETDSNESNNNILNDCVLKRNGEKANIDLILHKNLIINSIDYIFDMTKQHGDSEITSLVEKYFSLAVYLLAQENLPEADKNIDDFKNILIDLKQKNIDFDIVSTKYPKNTYIKCQKRLSLINLIKNTKNQP